MERLPSIHGALGSLLGVGGEKEREQQRERRGKKKEGKGRNENIKLFLWPLKALWAQRLWKEAARGSG